MRVQQAQQREAALEGGSLRIGARVLEQAAVVDEDGGLAVSGTQLEVVFQQPANDVQVVAVGIGVCGIEPGAAASGGRPSGASRWTGSRLSWVRIPRRSLRDRDYVHGVIRAGHRVEGGVGYLLPLLQPTFCTPPRPDQVACAKQADVGVRT